MDHEKTMMPSKGVKKWLTFSRALLIVVRGREFLVALPYPPTPKTLILYGKNPTPLPYP